MTEVEIKMPIANAEETVKDLMRLGFRHTRTVTETDVYFDNEIHFIRESGQALRIRTVQDMFRGSSVESFITFKGKKLDSISMTRRELESRVEKAEVLTEILHELGFREASPCVRKLRRGYSLGFMSAYLDSVDGLGDFLEIEIVQNETDSREDALEDIADILNKMGFSMKDTITRSYLSLLQQGEKRA